MQQNWHCDLLATLRPLKRCRKRWRVGDLKPKVLILIQLQNGALLTSKAMLEFIFLYLFDLDNATVGPSVKKVLGERNHAHIDKKCIN